MARTLKTFTCRKCGLPFIKRIRGIVLSPEDQKLLVNPVCVKCKSKSIWNIFKNSAEYRAYI